MPTPKQELERAEQLWYRTDLKGRKDAEYELTRTGDFLVRPSKKVQKEK